MVGITLRVLYALAAVFGKVVRCLLLYEVWSVK